MRGGGVRGGFGEGGLGISEVAGWGEYFVVGSVTSLIHGCHSSVWVELGNLYAKLG